MIDDFKFKNQLFYENQLNQLGNFQVAVDVDLDTSNTLAGVFNPESINERLGQGDMTALDELDKFKIPYTLQESNGKTIIKYEYNGTKYTVNCYFSESSDTETTEDNKDDSETLSFGGDLNLKEFHSLIGLNNFGFVKFDGTLDKFEPVDTVVTVESTTSETSEEVENGGSASMSENATNTITLDISEVVESISEILSKVENRDLSTIINGQSTIHTEFGMDKNGNLVFEQASTQKVFDLLLESVKNRILEMENGAAILQRLGGEDVLNQLIQSAWIANYAEFDSSKSNSSANFVLGVLEKFEEMLAKIQSNPDNLKLYATRSSYADSSLTDGLVHYNAKTTYGGDERINYSGTITTEEDGTVHIANEKDDSDYQSTMSALLERLKEKYPNVNESILIKIFQAAQKEALETLQQDKNDCPYGTANNGGRVEDITKNWGGNNNRKGDSSYIDMDQLVQMTLYCFDKQFINALNDGTIYAVDNEKAESVNTTDNNVTIDVTNPVVSIAQDIQEVVPEVENNDLAAIIGNNSTIHTEFGMDRNGNIVFQDSETANVYANLCKYVQQELLKQYDSNAFSEFGGIDALNKLIQAAWITAYNTFDSSQRNGSVAFISEVLDNLKQMVQKLQSNPELLSIFTQRSSYSDTSLTDNLIHYNTNTTNGGDERIIYSGTVTTDDNGAVHIANTTDDGDYQITMNALLQRLVEKYPSIDQNTIKEVFRAAQKEALEILQSDVNDCPYGTANNSGRVEDYNKDWGGKDNRKGDNSYIHMDQLVQMTLYCFDKLIYQKLIA